MKQVAERIYDLLLGCPHKNIGRPFTLDGRTYRVCCDCGHEFAYSLESMSIIPCDHRNEELSEYAIQESH